MWSLELKIYHHQNALQPSSVSDDGAPGFCRNIKPPNICDTSMMVIPPEGPFHDVGIKEKIIVLTILAATKQLYEWSCPSVRPYVRTSVRRIFFTMFPLSYHHEIFRSYYQWLKWCACKRSRSEVKGQGHRGQNPTIRFRIVTPVWLHQWLRNDAQSLK